VRAHEGKIWKEREMMVRIVLCLLASVGGYVFGGGGWPIGAPMLLCLFFAGMDEVTGSDVFCPPTRVRALSTPAEPF
jgi:hypothetical protein